MRHIYQWFIIREADTKRLRWKTDGENWAQIMVRGHNEHVSQSGEGVYWECIPDNIQAAEAQENR